MKENIVLLFSGGYMEFIPLYKIIYNKQIEKTDNYGFIPNYKEKHKTYIKRKNYQTRVLKEKSIQK